MYAVLRIVSTVLFVIVFTQLVPLVTLQGTATQALETTPAARNESKLSHEGSIGKNAVAAVT